MYDVIYTVRSIVFQKMMYLSVVYVVCKGIRDPHLSFDYSFIGSVFPIVRAAYVYANLCAKYTLPTYINN